MKILLISKWVAGATRGDFFYPGAWRDTYELALALTNERLEVAILTSQVRPEHKSRFRLEFCLSLRKSNIKHYFAPTYSAFGAEWGLVRLKLFLAELRTLWAFHPDIVQYMQFGASLLYPWLKGIPLIFYSCYLFAQYANEKKDLAAKRLDWGIPDTVLNKFCLMGWNLLYLCLSYLFGAMTLPQMAKRGALFALMHEKGFQKARRQFGRTTSVAYIQKGVDLPHAVLDPRNLKRPNDKILFIGSILYGKGIFDLLEAMRLLQKKLPHVKLTIVGTGPESLVQQMLAFIKIHRLNVTYEGSKHYQYKWKLYDNHTIFCLPSYSDAYPSVILEAMAVGLPVVTTDAVDSPVTHDRSGLVVPVGKTEALSNAMYQLLTETNKRQKMSQAETREVIKYSWVQTAKQFSKFYRELLQSNT